MSDFSNYNFAPNDPCIIEGRLVQLWRPRVFVELHYITLHYLFIYFHKNLYPWECIDVTRNPSCGNSASSGNTAAVNLGKPAIDTFLRTWPTTVFFRVTFVAYYSA